MIPLTRKIIIQKFKNYFWHLPKAIFFNLYYGSPAKKLVLIGVTGTDGKTTTATLIYNLLLSQGYKTGLVSTISAITGNSTLNTGLHTTSPDPATFQKILKEMVNNGLSHAVIEVTAHALDQFRTFGCSFEYGILTNTSHEHLDDFVNMDYYLKTKSKLLKNSRQAIINRDDPSYSYLKNNLKIPTTSYGQHPESNFVISNISLSPNTLSFEINHHQFQTNSPYTYQAYNIAPVAVLCSFLKINYSALNQIINNFPETKGRREEVKNPFSFKTIIDFAHTPAALNQTLSSLKKTTPGRLIVIFGATGGRDKSKRPEMGLSVYQNANIAFITADDTRNEDIAKINKDIIRGIPDKLSQNIPPPSTAKDYRYLDQQSEKLFIYINQPDRQLAFNQAVILAKSGDTIVACGKGHETTILHGDTEFPWSETEAFRTSFRYRSSKGIK